MFFVTKDINIPTIIVSTRIRKDMGGIEELAADIKERGLINPITVMDCGDDKYQLIAGLRRLEAYKRLGFAAIRSSILSPIEADEALQMEYAENVQRKDFTVAERLEYADKIKAVEKMKARERQALYAGGRNQNDHNNISPLPHKRTEVVKGESRQAIAEKAGFTSHAQYERAEKVAACRPDLLEKIDSGETTIYGAYKQVVEEAKETEPDPIPLVEKSRPKDQIVRAGHERLMKNPLYSQLYANWKKAVADMNTAVTELEFRTRGYENRIRNYQDNVSALSRRCEDLEQENAALHNQLDK